MYQNIYNVSLKGYEVYTLSLLHLYALIQEDSFPTSLSMYVRMQ